MKIETTKLSPSPKLVTSMTNSSSRRSKLSQLSREVREAQKSASSSFLNALHLIFWLPIDDRRPMDAFRYFLQLFILQTDSNTGNNWRRIRLLRSRERFFLLSLYAVAAYYAHRVAATIRKPETTTNAQPRWWLSTFSLIDYMISNFERKHSQIANLQIALTITMGVMVFTMALVGDVSPVLRLIYLQTFGRDAHDNDDVDDADNGDDNRHKSSHRDALIGRQNSKTNYWERLYDRELPIRRKNFSKFNQYLRHISLNTVFVMIVLLMQTRKSKLLSFPPQYYYAQAAQFGAMLYFQMIVYNFFLHICFAFVGLGIVMLKLHFNRLREIRAEMRKTAKAAAAIIAQNFVNSISASDLDRNTIDLRARSRSRAQTLVSNNSIRSRWRRSLVAVAAHIRRLNDQITLLCASNKFFRNKLFLALIFMTPASQTMLILSLLNLQYLLELKSWLLLVAVMVTLVCEFVVYFFTTYSSSRLNSLLYGAWSEINQFHLALFAAAASTCRKSVKKRPHRQQQQHQRNKINSQKTNFALRWKVANYLERMRPRWNGEGVSLGSFLLVKTVFVGLVIRYFRYTLLTTKLLKA